MLGGGVPLAAAPMLAALLVVLASTGPACQDQAEPNRTAVPATTSGTKGGRPGDEPTTSRAPPPLVSSVAAPAKTSASRPPRRDGATEVLVSGARLRSCRNSDRAPARCDGPWYEVGSFRIDRAEVTVGAYRRCVEAGACSIAGLDYNAACNWAPERVGRQLERQAEHPINCVTWEQARDYCQWAGARLPTWEEWTAAARGPEGRIYVWGNEMPAHLYPALELACWRQQTSTCVVGTKSARNAPFGLQDMAGNVAEWTASAPTERALRRQADPTMRGQNWRWSCGASWLSPMLDEPELLSLGRCDLRLGSKRDIGLGLRCAR